MSLFDRLRRRFRKENAYVLVSCWSHGIPSIEGVYRNKSEAQDAFGDVLVKRLHRETIMDSCYRGYRDCVADMEYVDKETGDYLKVERKMIE